MSRIIGIAGAARSGKDTVATIIKRLHPEFAIYDLSRPGKEALRQMFGWWTWHHTDGDLKDLVDPLLGKSPRQIMQTLLTDWAQKMVREDIWCLVAEQRLKDCAFVVIPGIRFEHQMRWVQKIGGRIIHVSRQQKAQVNQHVSEADMSPFLSERDGSISNDGTLEQLQSKIEALLNSWENG